MVLGQERCEFSESDGQVESEVSGFLGYLGHRLGAASELLKLHANPKRVGAIVALI